MYFPQEIFEEIVSYTGTDTKQSNKFLIGHVYFSVPKNEVNKTGYNVEVIRVKVIKRTPKTITMQFLKTTDKLSFDPVNQYKKSIKTIVLKDDNEVESVTFKCEEYSTTITARDEMLYAFRNKEAYKSFYSMYTFQGVVFRHFFLISEFRPNYLLKLWMDLTAFGMVVQPYKWVKFFTHNCKIIYQAITGLKIDDSFSPRVLKNKLDMDDLRTLFINSVTPLFHNENI